MSVAHIQRYDVFSYFGIFQMLVFCLIYGDIFRVIGAYSDCWSLIHLKIDIFSWFGKFQIMGFDIFQDATFF